MTQAKEKTIKDAVKDRYGSLARKASQGEAGSCWDSGAPCGEPSPYDSDTWTPDKIYSQTEIDALPDTVTAAAAGCGNPTALTELKTGETVLDLGSGGGIDCFLARQQVGPEGHVIGLDMTTDMINLARGNAEKLGYDNVEFRQGEMENMPVDDSSVDMIISNCVINLSPDKDTVFAEAFRVLKPGGRLCVSDIVLEGQLPDDIRTSLEQWVGCIAGALIKDDYLQQMRNAGFSPVQVVEQSDYASEVEGGDKVLSVTIKAEKP
jgi:SAM-dependent methyltransferase